MTMRATDARRMLSLVADAHEVDGPVALNRELVDRLVELVDCEFATYQEFDYTRRRVTAYVACSNEGAEAVPPPYVDESYWETHDRPQRMTSPFSKLSDEFDREERERMRDRGECNPEFQVVDTLVFGVGDSQTMSGWLAFDTQHRDFGERDRELVLALRPHIRTLWRNAVSRRQMAELVGALEASGEAAGRAVVLFECDGRINHATSEAQRLLACWFGTRNGHLPDELHAWSTAAVTGDSYVSRRNGSILKIEATGEFTFTLCERAADHARLTPREREVLGLVADGLTNAEIARKLWVVESTVAKHLEQAYSKLGVHNRTAAVARLATLAN